MVEIESCIFQLSISTIQNYLISIQGKYIYIYIYILKNTYSPPNPLNKNELIYVSSVLHYLRSSTDIHTDTILNK